MGVVLLGGSSTTAWESFSGSVLQTGGWNTLSAQVAGGSGVLRWRQAKKQLQRLPSGQQISHISGSSTCCFCFQTQTDPEELSSITSILSSGRNPVRKSRVWHTIQRKLAGSVVPWAWEHAHRHTCPLQVLQVLQVFSLGLEMLEHKQHLKQSPTDATWSL